jgi:hypothetical protein
MPSVAQQRKEYLDGVADVALAEQAEIEITRQEREDQARDKAERLTVLRSTLAKHEEDRITAVDRAEVAARELVAALSVVLMVSDEMKNVIKQMHQRVPSMLDSISIKRRMSERIAAVFKTLVGISHTFGQVKLETTWRQPDEDWVFDETSILSEDLNRITNGEVK